MYAVWTDSGDAIEGRSTCDRREDRDGVAAGEAIAAAFRRAVVRPDRFHRAGLRRWRGTDEVMLALALAIRSRAAGPPSLAQATGADRRAWRVQRAWWPAGGPPPALEQRSRGLHCLTETRSVSALLERLATGRATATAHLS